jgi:hypothetical protein
MIEIICHWFAALAFCALCFLITAGCVLGVAMFVAAFVEAIRE